MFHWFETRVEFEAFVKDMEPMRSIVERYLESEHYHNGYCAACRKIVRFRLPRSPNGEWCDLRESFLCDCGLNGRMRAIYVALEQCIAPLREPRVLLLERLTPLYQKLAERFPFVEGCEFLGPDVEPGTIRRVHGCAVRHESMLALSCPSDSLSVVFHGDVLEHVPDHIAGLRQCYRVLRPEGAMLFTCPFFNLEAHIVRCSVIGGAMVHHLPAAFHGNPVSNEGSLVFSHHGWPLLEEVKAVGFSRVRIGMLYDPFQGIVSNNNPYSEGHMWPVLFEAVK